MPTVWYTAPSSMQKIALLLPSVSDFLSCGQRNGGTFCMDFGKAVAKSWHVIKIIVPTVKKTKTGTFHSFNS